MELKTIQDAIAVAMKQHENLKVETLRSVVAAVKKAAIDKRIEIDEKLVDEVLLKEKKTIQEMIDTCPVGREENYVKYWKQMDIVDEFAPQLINNPEEIKEMVVAALANARLEAGTANKGQIMKVIMPIIKGKADMRVVNQVVADILKGE